jgi:predicted acyl esterase
MQRTPYSCAPYGPDQFKKSISPSETMMEEGYIVVYQDVRGRWMSDGLYDNMRAIFLIKIKTDVDEASDTYDTIDWLVKIQTITMGIGIWEFHTPGFMLLILIKQASCTESRFASGVYQ